MSALALRPAEEVYETPEPPVLRTHEGVSLLEQQAWQSLRRRDARAALDDLERAIDLARRLSDRRAVARISLLASRCAALSGQELLAQYYADDAALVLQR